MQLALDMSTTPQHTTIADRHHKVLARKERAVNDFLSRYVGTAHGDPTYDALFQSIMRGTRLLRIPKGEVDVKRLKMIQAAVEKRWRLRIEFV